MKNKQIVFQRVLGFAFAILTMIFIFIMSSQPAPESSETSADLIDYLAQIFNPDYSDLSPFEKEVYVADLQFYVRKAAHFSLYAFMAFSLSSALITFENFKIKTRFLISFFTAAIYSATDEFHQLFVPGRSGEIRDILIDSAGAVLGCLMLYLAYRIYKKHIVKGVAK